MNRKLLIRLIGVLLCFYGFAFAQEPKYPTKPITIVVGYAPGGSTDTVARLIGQEITNAMGRPVIVENRPGASQNIAAEYVARAPKDGYTLFMAAASVTVNISIYSKLNYDPVKDFAQVEIMGTVPHLLVVHPSFPATSIEELIAYIKKNPGKLNYASAGIGTSPHLSGELFKKMINVDVTHMPFKGAAPAVTGVATGEAHFLFTTIGSAWGMLQAGKVKALGITSAQRSPQMPEIRTMIEGGLPGFVTLAWDGLLAPAGTPGNVISALNSVIVNAKKREDFSARLDKLGYNRIAGTPEDFRNFFLAEIERWRKVAKEGKITAE
jgi:tripartite-type tricarboxylate transporter receptor subunit TctC